jgi:hypothetical protein
VAVVQNTFTHKKYRERHKTNNTQNNTKIHRTKQKYIEQHKYTQNKIKILRTTQKYAEQSENTYNNTKIHRTAQK